MAKVGELVEAAAGAARQRHFTEHPPFRVPGGGGFSVDDDAGRMWIVRGLKALGIWDAEVLDAGVCDKFCADCAEHLEIDGLPELVPFGKQRFRVIVIPQEEE